MNHPNPDQLIKLFNGIFVPLCNTRLDYCQNEQHEEPIYLPADEKIHHHRILFAHGFFTSALHEISHWCIAGKERRLLVDFGYWYEPDGRSAEQQREFELVEVKPQALEWILSKSCGIKFNISTDNLEGDPEAIALGREVFARNLLVQVKKYLETGLPERAGILKTALLDYYLSNKELTYEQFQLSELISIPESST